MTDTKHRYVCTRKRCEWRKQGEILCIMASKCPYGERYLVRIREGDNGSNDKR